MQRAGKAASAEIARRYAPRFSDGVAVFTGPGNNGGDGWVVAGELARQGVDVTVMETGVASPQKAPDAIAMRTAAIDSVRLAPSVDSPPGVIVDALLGTGFEGEPRGEIGRAIEMVNHLRGGGARTAALDVPSGLNATNGEHSNCVIADLTVSFGAVKRGTLLARDCCGSIVVVDIGLDEPGAGGVEQPATGTLPMLVDAEFVRERIPAISYDAHKGTRKHLAIIGGAPGMPGAVVLAARGALRSGIGLVRLLVAPENVGPVLAAVPSALISEWPARGDGIEALIAKWANAIVVGPGLGKSAKARQLIGQALKGSSVPTLLDADALNLFEGDTESLAALLAGRAALITPHPAEFARLAATDVKTVLANRFDFGVDLARALGATILLKGTPTVIFSPDGSRYVVARGSAALGTGGSGDLLDGIAGTMLAQTGEATAAAAAAAWVHGRAAELCEYVRGTTLDDVLYALPRAWNELEPAPTLPVLAELPAVSS
jgi:NAD(P)H-hydrate epimerase